jgi:hypothetical protein
VASLRWSVSFLPSLSLSLPLPELSKTKTRWKRGARIVCGAAMQAKIPTPGICLGILRYLTHSNPG